MNAEQYVAANAKPCRCGAAPELVFVISEGYFYVGGGEHQIWSGDKTLARAVWGWNFYESAEGIHAR